VRVVLTPFQAPNANAYAERFVRTIREECLDSLVLFGERRLIRALDEFMAHYHGERNHQRLGNDLIALGPNRSRVPAFDAVSGWAKMRLASTSGGSSSSTRVVRGP
jgi:transposase InsO family protein